MKNINQIACSNPNGKSAPGCNCKGYFCQTPNGADYTTCPFCDGSDYCYLNYNKPNVEKKFAEVDKKDNYSHPIYEDFCDSCGILFRAGCRHQANGCTGDIYNAHVIRKWKYIPSNDIFIGMPGFESVDEWLKEIDNIEVLDWICLGAGHCPTGSLYPKSSHPQYYSDCPLTK